MMSETKHTLSQIWNDGVMIKANGALIGQATSEEYARRIVACVNACDGIPNVQLECDNVEFVRIFNERNTLKHQRDELLSLLTEVAGNFTRYDDLPDNLLPRIDATIAKVKGK